MGFKAALRGDRKGGEEASNDFPGVIPGRDRGLNGRCRLIRAGYEWTEIFTGGLRG